MINNKSLNKDVLSNQTLSNRRKAMEIILSGGHTENKAIKNIVECVNQQTFAYNTIQDKILESAITFDKIYEMLNTYGRCAIIVIIANILKNNLDYVIVEKNGQEQKISASLLENIEKSPEEYTLTVVKNKYEYEKYKCIFDVNTVDTNIFFSIVGRMQSWFFGLCKYVNVIENQYVGKGKYESLSKEVVNLKNSLRGIIQNPYWYIEDKLKSIFTGDISEKLKAVKYDIDNTMINLQNSLKTDVDYIFPETLQGWYEKLPSNAKIRIYKNGEEKFLDICKDSENNIQLIDILAFYLTGLSIENWSENTPSTFYEQLICMRNTIEKDGTTEFKNGFKITYIDKKNSITEKIFDLPRSKDFVNINLLKKDIIAILKDYSRSISHSDKIEAILDVAFSEEVI